MSSMMMIGCDCVAKREHSHSSYQRTQVEVTNLASTHALIPATRLDPMHVEAIGEHGKGVRWQLQLGVPHLRRAWPVECALFQTLGHEPNAFTIPLENFVQVLPLIGEHKQSTTARVLLELVSEQRIDARAHIARFHRDEHAQAAREAQQGLARAAMACATCGALTMSNFAPPGRSTSRT